MVDVLECSLPRETKPKGKLPYMARRSKLDDQNQTQKTSGVDMNMTTDIIGLLRTNKVQRFRHIKRFNSFKGDTNGGGNVTLLNKYKDCVT